MRCASYVAHWGPPRDDCRQMGLTTVYWVALVALGVKVVSGRQDAVGGDWISYQFLYQLMFP